MEGNDWDLFAVVRRGCRRFRESTSEVADPFPSYASLLPLETGNNKAGNNLVDESDYRVSGFEELEEFLKPYFSKPYQSQPSSSSAPPAVKASVEPTVRVPPRPPNRRRRRNQQKKVVCHVPADSLSSDMWAWRKYGQKPIKGSPYPRGYYRCSSSKGCLARKQMERSRSDPGMFIITYTAEHNHPVPTHRNSLAGSTRHKVPSPPHSANRPRPPSPATAEAAELSPTTPLTASTSTEEEEEDEGMLVVEDMEVLGEDDFLIMGDQHTNTTASASNLSGFDDDDEDFDPFFAQPWLFANAGSKAAAAGGI